MDILDKHVMLSLLNFSNLRLAVPESPPEAVTRNQSKKPLKRHKNQIKEVNYAIKTKVPA